MSTAPHSDLNLAQVSQVEEFYAPLSDNIVYHITCEILKDSQSENSVYDYEFFFHNYHVKCKAIPMNLVVYLLNKKFYNKDFDKRSGSNGNINRNMTQLASIFGSQSNFNDMFDNVTPITEASTVSTTTGTAEFHRL
ncbi:hypothetical protein C1645_835599 [Glomus cerebriforme]|uniref:Uncharacterized protein n=1 Tax=Glomus cerebriforme TaxID=658196 RepID=A0A397SBP5_9GLOM|nr:hypothetical protein C1645_835599 [Glomus cerebriforme]